MSEISFAESLDRLKVRYNQFSPKLSLLLILIFRNLFSLPLRKGETPKIVSR
jgi:hypothetical protein